jgi:hypothetical protein
MALTPAEDAINKGAWPTARIEYVIRCNGMALPEQHRHHVIHGRWWRWHKAPHLFPKADLTIAQVRRANEAAVVMHR